MTNELGAKIAKRIYNVALAIVQSPLPEATQNLVMLRASQINGCGFCVDYHTKDATAAGEDSTRLNLVAAWREGMRPSTDDLAKTSGKAGQARDPSPAKINGIVVFALEATATPMSAGEDQRLNGLDPGVLRAEAGGSQRRCGRDVETGVAAPSQGQMRPAWPHHPTYRKDSRHGHRRGPRPRH
jgi:AhpD family alkylhydroperoxidase